MWIYKHHTTAGIKYWRETSSCRKIRWRIRLWMISGSKEKYWFMYFDEGKTSEYTRQSNYFQFNIVSGWMIRVLSCDPQVWYCVVLTAHCFAGVDLLSREELLEFSDVHTNFSHEIILSALTDCLRTIIPWKSSELWPTQHKHYTAHAQQRNQVVLFQLE